MIDPNIINALCDQLEDPGIVSEYSLNIKQGIEGTISLDVKTASCKQVFDVLREKQKQILNSTYSFLVDIHNEDNIKAFINIQKDVVNLSNFIWLFCFRLTLSSLAQQIIRDLNIKNINCDSAVQIVNFIKENPSVKTNIKPDVKMINAVIRIKRFLKTILRLFKEILDKINFSNKDLIELEQHIKLSVKELSNSISMIEKEKIRAQEILNILVEVFEKNWTKLDILYFMHL